MHSPHIVERLLDPPNRPQPKVVVAECPMCRIVVPADQLTHFVGRRICQNCAAAWFEDDEPEKNDKTDA